VREENNRDPEKPSVNRTSQTLAHLKAFPTPSTKIDVPYSGNLVLATTVESAAKSKGSCSYRDPGRIISELGNWAHYIELIGQRGFPRAVA
jgi:hypothetical protein